MRKMDVRIEYIERWNGPIHTADLYFAVANDEFDTFNSPSDYKPTAIETVADYPNAIFTSIEEAIDYYYDDVADNFLTIINAYTTNLYEMGERIMFNSTQTRAYDKERQLASDVLTDISVYADIPALKTGMNFHAVATSGNYNDLTNKPSIPAAFSASPATRSIVTGTGATGFQVSATRGAMVNYSVNTSTTANIGGNSSVAIVLEIAPTNSTTAGDWVEISRFSNGQALTLAITLQSVQSLSGKLGGYVPAGYYAKLRSITAGTASSSYQAGQEILM